MRVTQATLHYWLEGKKWRERLTQVAENKIRERPHHLWALVADAIVRWVQATRSMTTGGSKARGSWPR